MANTLNVKKWGLAGTAVIAAGALAPAAWANDPTTRLDVVVIGAINDPSQPENAAEEADEAIPALPVLIETEDKADESASADDVSLAADLGETLPAQ